MSEIDPRIFDRVNELADEADAAAAGTHKDSLATRCEGRSRPSSRPGRIIIELDSETRGDLRLIIELLQKLIEKIA